MGPLPAGLFQKVPGHRTCLASVLPASQPCQNRASFLRVSEGKESITLLKQSFQKAVKMSSGAPEVGMGAQGDRCRRQQHLRG